MPLQRTTPKDSRPYYKEAHALSIKVYADAMIESGHPQRIYASTLGVSVHTLEKHISQAACYLMDHFDTPERKYLLWRRSVKVTKREGCVVLQWRTLGGGRFREVVDATPPGYTPVDTLRAARIDGRRVEPPAPVTMDWQKPFDEFILGEGRATLKIEELELSSEELGYISSSLVGMTGFRLVKLDKHNIIIERN